MLCMRCGTSLGNSSGICDSCRVALEQDPLRSNYSRPPGTDQRVVYSRGGDSRLRILASAVLVLSVVGIAYLVVRSPQGLGLGSSSADRVYAACRARLKADFSKDTKVRDYSHLSAGERAITLELNAHFEDFGVKISEQVCGQFADTCRKDPWGDACRRLRRSF